MDENQNCSSIELGLGLKPAIKRDRKDYENIDAIELTATSFRPNIFNLRFALYIIVFVLYLVIGGLSLQSVETPMEKSVRSQIEKTKKDFLSRYPVMNVDDLEEFLSAMVSANDRGISPLQNASNDRNWSFGHAFFFCSTVVTTIGYGHVTPLSQTGKLFCVFYASVGIPLTMVLISAAVDRLLTPCRWLLSVLNATLSDLLQPLNIRIMHLAIIVLLLSCLFLVIPSIIFAYLEPDWSTLDAFYYCFISLTTVGLGDYIPGYGVPAEFRALYNICISVYLLCGVTGMTLALRIFADIPQLNLGKYLTESASGRQLCSCTRPVDDT